MEGVASTDKLLIHLNGVFDSSSVINFPLWPTTWGKYIMTNKMVPISRNVLKSPKSRKATASKGMRAKKAPTVVIFPMIKGEATSRKAALTLVAEDRWAIRCRG